MVHYFSTVSKILFLNLWVLLRFRIFFLSSEFGCFPRQWLKFLHQSIFLKRLILLFVFLESLWLYQMCENIETIQTFIIHPGQNKLFHLGESTMIWHLQLYICEFFGAWVLLHSSKMQNKMAYNKNVHVWTFVQIVNKWIDNYYTVPCVKQKCWLRIIIIFGSFNNCLYLQVAGRLILVVQRTTMFHDLVVTINFWCSLMTGCPLICNPNIFRPHPHISGYFLNPQIFLCRLKNFHVHT